MTVRPDFDAIAAMPVPDRPTSPYEGRLLGYRQVLDLPPVEWEIEGWLPGGSLALVYGKWGAGKTVLVLHLALCIAAGEPWFGRPIRPGHVVYCAAESVRGIRGRLVAWYETFYDRDDQMPRFLLLDEDNHPPVNLLNDDDVSDFIDAVAPFQPRLIVFDTLARHMVAGDENSARDMGLAVANMDRIRKRTGAVVMPIHHPDKAENWARGSGALTGATDTEWFLKKTNAGNLALTCKKQKDGVDPAPLYFELHSADIGNGHTAPILRSRADDRSLLGISDSERTALTLLSDIFGDEPPSSTAWQRAFEQETGMSEATFRRAKKALLEDGFVERIGGRKPNHQGAAYQITEAGHTKLRSLLSSTVHSDHGQ